MVEEITGAQTQNLGQAQTQNLGKAETANLGQAGNPTEKKPEVKPEPEKPITDYKVAEIWIRSGQVMLDASESFWTDRCRALGLLELCKEIVKTAQAPEKPKNRIIPAKGSFLNGLRGLGRKR